MKEKKKISILLQVAILFAIAITITAVITYVGQKRSADASVREQTEALAKDTAHQVVQALKEYPAYEWLLRYWSDHSDELNVEYDVNFRNGAATRMKCTMWGSKHPTHPLRYVTTAELSVMSAEDQKLFAEIMYSWLITHVNQIKASYDAEFLFCCSTDETCKEQFFIFSAADKGAVRSNNYGDVFLLGTERSVEPSQQKAMQQARDEKNMLADAGVYVDYYVYMGQISGRELFIGLTFTKDSLLHRIRLETKDNTEHAIFYQVILVVLAMLMLLVYVIRPLRTVQRNIRLYKKTKDSKTVAENLAAIHTKNEIEELAEDVIGLTAEIDDYVSRIGTITAEKERISTELALAENIQKSMLPSTFPAFPDHTEFDVYATMTPAKEVGGDFYDFRMLDDDHLYITIADVSGKGVPAALFMMSTMIILANNAKSGKSPSEILQDTNNTICKKNPEEMFVTVWVGILELSTGKMKAANAGHEYPIIMQPAGPFKEERDVHGMVLGAMDGMKFPEYEICLQSGAKLFLFTDGISEATNAEQKMFGVKRLVEVLNGVEEVNAAGPEDVAGTIASAATANSLREGAPQDILAGVSAAVDGFVKEAPQFDDMTMVCLEYSGHNIGA